MINSQNLPPESPNEQKKSCLKSMNVQIEREIYRDMVQYFFLANRRKKFSVMRFWQTRCSAKNILRWLQL